MSCTVSALACGHDFEARRAAYALPVYASQPGSPPNHATLGSGWSLPFAGRVRPAGFDGRFQFAINFLLLQAFLAHARIQQTLSPVSGPRPPTSRQPAYPQEL